MVNYPPVDPKQVAFVEIYPAIGIARVGNSDQYFIGPEVPEQFVTPDGGFKHQGKVKKQAARFRVYAYDKTGKILGELNQSNGYKLTWNVNVANKKPAWYAFNGMYQGVI